MESKDFVTNQKKQIRVLYITTLVLLLPLIASIYFLYIQNTEQNKPSESTMINDKQKIFVNLNPVQTDAYSALVVSLNTGDVLYQKNPDKQLPLASLTKLITAKVAQDHIKNNTVTVQKMDDFVQYGDQRLSQNDTWQKEELIEYMLVTSSNDGAHTLAQNTNTPNLFIENMNSLVASIGLSNTRFYNETGLDDDSKGIIASKGTASDISKILSYILKTELPLYEKTRHELISVSTPHGIQTATNTNETVEKITGILVSKTGYTDLAGGNLAVVADMGLNEPTAFIVLKSSKGILCTGQRKNAVATNF
jgi:D-alanyl-D-alanine endopeptidase (penicillin-binding protein 7)